MYEQIYGGINNALTNLIGNLPELAVENVGFEPTDVLTPWMRSTMLPAEPSQATIGWDRVLRYAGVVQVDYFVPKDSTAYNDGVQTIINWFNSADNRSMLFDGVGFQVERSWRGVGVTDSGGSWHQIPIYVRYLTYDSQ